MFVSGSQPLIILFARVFSAPIRTSQLSNDENRPRLATAPNLNSPTPNTPTWSDTTFRHFPGPAFQGGTPFYYLQENPARRSDPRPSPSDHKIQWSRHPLGHGFRDMVSVTSRNQWRHSNDPDQSAALASPLHHRCTPSRLGLTWWSWIQSSTLNTHHVIGTLHPHRHFISSVYSSGFQPRAAARRTKDLQLRSSLVSREAQR